MNTPEWQIKKQMCEIGYRIWQRGFCAGNEGNHSVRVGADRVLCTPTGISKGFLRPEDICAIDMDGNQTETNSKGRQRTSDAMVHLAIYKKRSDIKAVIHSHPPHAVAFCLANIPLPEAVHPEAEVFLGKTVFAEYATPGGPDLPNSFLDKITAETNTILMANHGSVNFAPDLTDAYYKLEILDNYCRQLLLARQLGQVQVLNNQQMVDLLKVKQRLGLSDTRLSCAQDGCVGQENQAFLATFPVQPTSARCHCNGGAVHTDAERPEPDLVDQQTFETSVQAITDQIMSAMNR